MKKLVELTDEEIEIIEKYRKTKDKFDNLCDKYGKLVNNLKEVLDDIYEIIEDNETYEDSFYCQYDRYLFGQLLDAFEIGE